MLEGSLGTATAPTLTALAEHGTLGRATTTFPSLTPVCLSSLATGAHPDVHEIPHLVWWHRGRATARGVRLLVRRCPRRGARPHAARHARRDERRAPRAVGGDGLRGARRRGPRDRRRQLHRLPRPHAAPRDRPVPRHRAGPGAVLLLQPVPERADRRAALVPEARGRHHRRLRRGRRPVARDARRLRLPPLLPLRLRLRLARGRARRGLGRARALRRGGRGARARGGRARRLRRAIRRRRHVRPRPVVGAAGRAARRPVPARARRRSSPPRTARGTSTGSARPLRPPASWPSGSTATRPSRWPSSARATPSSRGARGRRRASRRRAPGGCSRATRRSSTSPTPSRARSPPSRCPNAGEVLVSARDGWEFHDLGGGHHLGGGSHGSLTAADSLVPVLTVGLEAAAPRSIVDVAPLVLDHFGVAAPPYVLRRAA